VLALVEKLLNHTLSDLIFWKEELKTRKPPCGCDCERCTEQYRPLELSTEGNLRYDISMRYDITKAILEYFTTHIRNDRELINERLQSRGNIIIAPWKKSAEKRTNFLKCAEGQFHFLKWSGFSKDKLATWLQIQEDRMRNFVLLPYLTRATCG
jgi:hypothetical protein